MLERIENIAPGSDYQKSHSKSSTYARSGQFLQAFHSSMNDSISLSPATRYLSSIRWKLKKISNEKEKIIVEFEFDGFGFTATIDQINKTKSIDYAIRKTVNKIAYVYQVVIGITSGNLKKQHEKFDVLNQLPMLNLFFDELIRLSDYTTNISEDNIRAKEAFFEMERGLRPEFNYVSACVIAFIEKYLAMNLSVAEVEDRYTDNLILKKIQISGNRI